MRARPSATLLLLLAVLASSSLAKDHGDHRSDLHQRMLRKARSGAIPLSPEDNSHDRRQLSGIIVGQPTASSTPPAVVTPSNPPPAQATTTPAAPVTQPTSQAPNIISSIVGGISSIVNPPATSSAPAVVSTAAPVSSVSSSERRSSSVLSSSSQSVVQINSTSTVQPSSSSTLPPLSSASAAPSNSDSSSGGIGKGALVAVIVIASCVGGAIAIWTIITKWKFSPSRRFEEKLNPIDFTPATRDRADFDPLGSSTNLAHSNSLNGSKAGSSYGGAGGVGEEHNPFAVHSLAHGRQNSDGQSQFGGGGGGSQFGGLGAGAGAGAGGSQYAGGSQLGRSGSGSTRNLLPGQGVPMGETGQWALPYAAAPPQPPRSPVPYAQPGAPEYEYDYYGAPAPLQQQQQQVPYGAYSHLQRGDSVASGRVYGGYPPAGRY